MPFVALRLCWETCGPTHVFCSYMTISNIFVLEFFLCNMCISTRTLNSQIVREYINKHSGYEINTEGDSFSIAFLDVPRAVLFCLDVQQRLLETNWPPEVLRLPTCKPVRWFVLLLWGLCRGTPWCF